MTQPGTPGPDEPQFAPPSADAYYDPNQSYVIYQAAPAGGYGVPVTADPLISPDYGGWWQRSIAILRGAWRQLVVLQAVGFLVGLAVSVPEAMRTDGVRIDPQSNDLGPLFALLSVMVLALLAVAVIGALVTVAGNHVAVSFATGRPPRIGAALGYAVRRCLPLLGWQLLAGLIMVVGFCACVLPGIYLYAVFLILPAVVTFERGGAAIARCFQLFHRDLGSSLARIATIAGILIGAGAVAIVVGAVVSGASGDPGQPDTLGEVLVSSVVSGLLSAAAKTVTDVLLVTAYADLRARHEPLSTPVLAAEIGLPVQ